MADYLSRKPRQRSAKPIIWVAVASFLLGGTAIGYITYKVGEQNGEAEVSSNGDGATATNGLAAQPSPSGSPTETPDGEPSPEPTESDPAVVEATEAVERVAEQQGGLDQRIAAAEQRITRLDLQTQAAAGNAARAEGLLIAFAARRALERGAELGFLADQLRLRFGDALPNAVNKVIEVSRDPITADQLIARLDGLAPQLAEPEQEPSFERLWDELGSLFTIRRQTTPSARPRQRLDRARLFLESGRIDAAIEEVRLMPGADSAQDWIADAQRFSAAQKALDLIETSAVLEPRRLRDGRGERIEQASPAAPESEQS